MKCNKCDKSVDNSTGLYCTGLYYGSICDDCYNRLQMSSAAQCCMNCGILVDNHNYYCSRCRRFQNLEYNLLYKKLLFKHIQKYTCYSFKDFKESYDRHGNYLNWVIKGYL